MRLVGWWLIGLVVYVCYGKQNARRMREFALPQSEALQLDALEVVQSSDIKEPPSSGQCALSNNSQSSPVVDVALSDRVLLLARESTMYGASTDSADSELS